MSRQICSHTSSALNAGAKRSGATCKMAMPQCCYLAKGAKRSSHTTNMLTSLNISVNWSIWSTHLVDTFVAHVTDAILSPKWLLTKCPRPKKTTPTQPERELPAVEVSPKSPCGAISLGRRPSYQRNPKMAQKVKKLRSLHILHVPPSRSKTSWHWRLMFLQSIVPYLWFLRIFGDVSPLVF